MVPSAGLLAFVRLLADKRGWRRRVDNYWRLYPLWQVDRPAVRKVRQVIPVEAVEAAAKGLAVNKWPTAIGVWESFGQNMKDDFRDQARAALEASAPYMQAEVERELLDAQRVIALLVSDAGGKVTLSRKAITELPADTVIETTQDVINGGWVIRAGSRQHGDD